MDYLTHPLFWIAILYFALLIFGAYHFGKKYLNWGNEIANQDNQKKQANCRKGNQPNSTNNK